MFLEKRSFKNSKGLILSAIFEGPDKKVPVVVLCHGYTSSKDRFTTKKLAQKLLAKGLSVYRFDFTGHGESQGTIDDITPARGIDDLKSAIRDLGKKDFGLYGSSFGGYVSIYYASENPVKALALRAPVSSYISVLAANLWKDVKSSKSSFKRLITYFLELDSFNLYSRAKNIKAPTLIVHGEKDSTVPLSQSKKLFNSLKCEKRLEILKGTDHNFKEKELERLTNLVAEFFKNILYH